jgi:opacity protein-like surface antigen
MTNLRLAAAFVAAALLIAGTASAQQSAISFTPADPAQWDVAGHIGWVAAHKSAGNTVGDESFNVFAAGLSAGRYLTPHLKPEIHFASTGTGRLYRAEQLSVAGAPVYRARQHYFQTATLGAAVVYQFFENQWFHPFAGGGLEVARVHERVEGEQFSPPSPTRSIVSPLILPEEHHVSYAARPFITTGFKWYVAERAFLRTNVQASFSSRGTTQILWAAAVGVDL